LAGYARQPTQGPAAAHARAESIRSLRTISAGHAFVQNLCRGHYAITVDLPVHDRVRPASTELAAYL
jgi:hypothetical protein